MKKKEIKIKRNLLLAFVLLFALQINFMDAKADVKKTPWGVNTSPWSATVEATDRRCAYFSVTSFERDKAGAKILLKTTGDWVYVQNTVSSVATVATKKGQLINAKATNNGTGYWTYVRGSGMLYY